MCCSVAKSCLTLSNLMNYTMPSFLVLYYLPEFAQTHAIESVMTSNHLIPCHPLLLLYSVIPNIRVFLSESALHIRWPKYWSFSFNISPSNEYSGLTSFRIDWFDSLESSRDSEESSLAQPFESISFLVLSFLYGPVLTSIHYYWESHSF